MNSEDRFDRIVGLIYDIAHDTRDADDADGAQGPDAVMEAIRAELEALGESHEDADGLMRRLSPHLARSGRLRRCIQQLEVQQSVQQIELAHLPFGLVWVGAGLQVVTQNARAAAMLHESSGICVRDGRLTAWVATDMERLDLALQNALRPQERKGVLLALRRRGQAVPLLASVMPVVTPPGGAASRGGPGGLGETDETDDTGDTGESFALVILQNPDEVGVGLSHLQLVYGFTAAERKLAEALLNNETLDSYGERTAVSRSTLRSHLARLFKKTGTCRQSELVRLLMLARPMV